MLLERVHVQRRGFVQRFQRLEQPPRVNRERPDVLIVGAVIHEQCAAHVVGVEERGHLEVEFPCLPQRPPFGLERERRERPVAVAVACDARLEERCVHHCVEGTEGAIAVAADSHALAVDDPFFVQEVDHRRKVVAQVVDVVVVHAAGLADDGRIRLDDGVALQAQDLHGPHADVGEPVLVVRLSHSLVVVVLVRVLPRVEPDHPR